LLHESLQGIPHFRLNGVQPGLNLTTGFLHLEEGHFLSLVGEHCNDIKLIDLKPDEVIETGFKVLLDDIEVLRVGEDFQEFIIGEEIEARKGASLALEVVLELLLDVVEDLVVGSELVKEERIGLDGSEGIGLLAGLYHEEFEELVDLFEALGLAG
jgi:hypothetical protein